MSDIEEEYEFDEELVEDEFVFSDGDKTLNERMSATAKSGQMNNSKGLHSSFKQGE